MSRLPLVSSRNTLLPRPAPRAAEAKFAFSASAPNTDSSRRGLEAAVVTVLLDGEPTQDVVLYAGARPFTYKVALGRFGAGRHTVSLRLNRRSSPPAVGPVNTGNLRTQLAAAGDLVARHAPILYGRDLPEIAGRWENARTDVPMLAYHATQPQADGTRTIEYTVIWSNEDGGTNSPALMARWGRTTDIEWIYRVRVDAAGNALDAVYHGPNHEVLPFTGAKENDHPLLQTATSNNNLLQVDDPRLSSGYRFLELDTTRVQAGVGTTLAARVCRTWYTSHHAQNSWSIDRDGPAATTIELPAGTSAQDVEAIEAVGVPTATTLPLDWRIELKALNRGFMLGGDYLPQPSFVQWRGSLALTAAAPEAVVWTAGVTPTP